MSKIIWKALKLGPAVLGASFLVANSTLAAQSSPDKMAQDRKSVATDDQPIDSQLSLDKSAQEQQQQVKPETERLKASKAAVVPYSRPVNHKQVESESEGLKASKATVGKDGTLTNMPHSVGKSISPTAVAEAQNPEESTDGGQDQTNSYSNVDGADPMDQVTNVSQFSDVRPGDWAYEALRELVERYGCIAGYPDSTYRGNRAMTRYEFAAGLRACLNQIEKLIAASTTNFATKEDLEKLRRLTQEFQGELAALGTRVDKLEGRVGFLETHQFSTTTKLNAAIIFNADTFGALHAQNIAVPYGARRGSLGSLSRNSVISDRIRLNFDTSFTGKDRLRTRIEANSTTAINGNNLTGTNETRLAYDGITGAAPRGNSVVLGKLLYRFPLTTSTTVFLDATGGEFYDNINTLNPFLESSDIGSLSRFGRFNPIYRINNGGSASNTGAGATIVQKFSNNLSISAGYLARSAEDPVQSRGLFNGTYGAIGQLNFQATKAFGLGLTYAHSYYAGNRTGAIFNNEVGVTGGTGSVNANLPFGPATPTSTNAYGAEFSFRVSQFFNISGWGGVDYSTVEKTTTLPNNQGIARRGRKASSYNYAVALAFPDLGAKGNLGAIIFGQPPKATANNSGLSNVETNGPLTATGPRRRDRDTSYQAEVQYRIRVTNNIYVTPGGFVIIKPEDYRRNPTEYVGVLRTTFTF